MTLLIYMPTLPELFASMCMMRVTVVVKKTHEYHACPCGHFELKKKKCRKLLFYLALFLVVAIHLHFIISIY